MVCFSSILIYQELFLHKIKSSTKILIIDYNNNYNDLIENLNIIQEKNIKIDYINIPENIIKNLNKNEENQNINFYSNNILTFLTEEKYDNIIFFEIFSKININDMSLHIEKSKELLRSQKYGKIIFINNIITRYTQYMYHPFSYFRNYLIDNCVYITDMYDKIRENQLVVLDSYRIFTIDFPTYPMEFFSILCEIK